LAPQRLNLLIEACDGHEWGDVSSDPTIGCCWDADRLELSRLSRRPKERFLSTVAAREPELQAAAWERGQTRAVNPARARRWGFNTNHLIERRRGQHRVVQSGELHAAEARPSQDHVS
jgi:hypothetical protein